MTPAAVARALRGAGLSATLGALPVLACNTETIDLLPPSRSPDAGQGSGGDAPAQGGSTASDGGSAGAEGGSVSGASAAGFGGGGASGLGGKGPIGFGGNSGWPCLPGSRSCMPCENEGDCPADWRCDYPELGGRCVQPCGDGVCRPGQRCDELQQRCGPSCSGGEGCSEGRVCDAEQSVCVQCLVNADCETAGDPEERVCAGHRCVECSNDDDCTEGPRRLCVNTRCTECTSSKDCGPGGFCDVPRGRCE